LTEQLLHSGRDTHHRHSRVGGNPSTRQYFRLKAHLSWPLESDPQLATDGKKQFSAGVTLQRA